MKTTVVPAQITTVEDKVAGNLSVIQLFLLTLPVFLNGALFALFPPVAKITALKVTVGVVLVIVCMGLAIRIKGKLLLTWLAVMARYSLRPRYYIFNKNDLYLRQNPRQVTVIHKPVQSTKKKIPKTNSPLIPIPELVKLQAALADPRSHFRMQTNRKGDMNVYINEIK